LASHILAREIISTLQPQGRSEEIEFNELWCWRFRLF